MKGDPRGNPVRELVRQGNHREEMKCNVVPNIPRTFLYMYGTLF